MRSASASAADSPASPARSPTMSRAGGPSSRAQAPSKTPRARSASMMTSTSCSTVMSGVRRWISGSLGRLIGRVDAGEVLQLALPRLAVEALGIASFALGERRVDEDLHELVALQALARQPSLGAERRDERDQHDQAGIGHQVGRLDHAPDVLDPVGVGEAQVPVQAMADIVAIQRVGVPAERQQPLLDAVGDRRLARAREAGEPQDGRAMSLDRRPCGLVDGEIVPAEIGGAAQREADHAGADRRIADAGRSARSCRSRGSRRRCRRAPPGRAPGWRSRFRSSPVAWRPCAGRCRCRADA